MADGATPPPRLPLDWIAASLRRERTRAGLSLSELAKRAGIAKSTLSQLEAGSGNPSVETLWALGVALGVPFSALVEPLGVFRSGDPGGAGARGRVRAGELRGHAAVRQSARGAAGHLPPAGGAGGGARVGAAHSGHGGASGGEHGAGEGGAAGEEAELGPGDYMTYRGDVPHSYEALAAGTTFVLVMQHV